MERKWSQHDDLSGVDHLLHDPTLPADPLHMLP